MFKKEKPAAQEKMPQQRSRLWGVLFILLAAVFLVSYCALIESSITAFLDKAQLYLMGRGAILLPVFCLLAGVRVLLAKPMLPLSKKSFLLVLFTLCLLGTAHAVFTPVGEELYPERLLAGGGLIGGTLVLVLRRTIGQGISWYILLAGLAISTLCLLPMRSIGRAVKKLFFSHKKPVPQRSNQPTQAQPAEKSPKAMPKQQTPARPNPQRGSVYTSPEFKDYTEGLGRGFSFKNILKKDKGIYDKKEIAHDPVQIPEWEEPQILVRPVLDYDDGTRPLPEKQPRPSVEKMPQTTPAMDGRPLAEHASGAAKFAAQETPVIKNPYDSAVKEEEAGKKPAPIPSTRISIFDDAEKCPAPGQEAEAAPTDARALQGEQPTVDSYLLPPLRLLDLPVVPDPAAYERDIRHQCSVLEQTLADFRVRARVIAVTRGPSVTRFELEPAPGVKVSAVVNLADDIALKLAAPGVRIEAPIPGKSAIGIEAPNIKNDQVYFREVVDNDVIRRQHSPLCIGLGMDISGSVIPAYLDKMPHLLVAGSTGSGKSVCINTIIASILYKARPDEVKFILVDPKVVELSNYNGIPHLLTPVVTDAKKAASALHWAVNEMERRYNLFAAGHVRDIRSYNQQAEEKLPFIVIIIDELADLMMVARVDVEDAILRLAQKARAAGIHLILATQRPSVDVITGIVKANIPSRIAFAVSSQTDSRTILDNGGAEKLLGKGDMLFSPIGSKPVRVQGAFVSDAELKRIVDFIVSQSIPVNYTEEVTAQALECDKKKDNGMEDAARLVPAEDELFEDALRWVLEVGQVSASMLQRRLRIGYTRAARMVDTMEELGIVGQSVGSKPRDIILPREEVEERFLNHD